MANLFRLYLHVAALNLLVRLRHHVADPPPQHPAAELPREALAGQARRRFFNQRRERDPLGEGQACTWRMRLIKVAARAIETTRRIVVRLSGSWPYQWRFLEEHAHVAVSLRERQSLSPQRKVHIGCAQVKIFAIFGAFAQKCLKMQHLEANNTSLPYLPPCPQCPPWFSQKLTGAQPKIFAKTPR